MADTYYFIKDLINDLERGRIKIPSFQRGFVWEPNRVAYFIDSIYKGFPFGSVLLWRTRNPLRTERNLGPYTLPENDPEYPIDYVLDGQQRITSIFGIFQNSLIAEEEQGTDWTNLFFELNSKESVPFKHLDDFTNYDSQKFFPLKYVFNSPIYRQLTRNLDENLAQQIDNLVEKFTKSRIPVERFESEERKYVATVFERINDPENFMELPGSAVREKFDEIRRGIFRAIDFLKTDLNVFSLKLLPMENILTVLTAFFASSQKQPPPIPQDQYEVIKRWFWRACFSQRYARGGAKSTDQDLLEIQKLKSGKAHNLGDFDVSLNTDFFTKNVFRISSVATNTFILLLGQAKPLNFIQGTNISLQDVLSQGNRKEFHHIFPKAHLQRLEKYKDEQINCLANFSVLSRTDNNKIKDQSPSKYRSEMPTDDQILDQILATHFCPINVFTDDYESFLTSRAELLLKKAKELSQVI
ncbi:DUF262 domain-containing protein [Nostoc sp. CCCryo 231-06]|nr:DUF262 domain-containing protein [Nostoc sp. CCCryo 231-06]